MRKVDAFAHILPRHYRERIERHLESTMSSGQLRYYREGVFDFDPALTDLDARFRRLEALGDYAQVLVLAVPPIEETGPAKVAAEFARLANDEMADLVQRYPDRFVGFAAALPLHDTDATLLEIDRAVNELHAWLHPTRNATWTDYPTEAESDYGLWWSIGWPYETAAALSRLVYSGVMERHPDLKLIAHHGAGMVPHFSARLAMGPGYRQVKDQLPRPPIEYFRRFYADTALFGAPHAVRCVLDFFGPEHVLFGTDMPLGPPAAIEATIADIEEACLSEEHRRAVFEDNAARLLSV
ncbi:MAG: hypothetical protein AUI15_28855 [Actinobacteria bacterium 13_2_20CM_2_66_6]|nr:MAG: hypothetical protein AUI15_28855 [Actinobacteria bacterium 13_2_20CM_2_66_6]